MASTSKKYIIGESTKRTDRKGQSESFAFHALKYSIKTDLLPLLMATKFRIHRLPVVYLSEAHS